MQPGEFPSAANGIQKLASNAGRNLRRSNDSIFISLSYVWKFRTGNGPEG